MWIRFSDVRSGEKMRFCVGEGKEGSAMVNEAIFSSDLLSERAHVSG